jgi:DNA-binding beta-propeller fold protein YncE
MPTGLDSRGKRARGVASTVFVLVVAAGCVAGFIWLLVRPSSDPGVRVWLLNHAPDQVAVMDPYQGTVEKKFTASDGLRGLTFTRDGKEAFIYGVVDVTNKLIQINTSTYLKDDTLELDGIPQGIAVFPDDRRVAIILGSKTDFMSGGFDVLDLKQRSKADPTKRLDLMRVRDLQLSHKIAIGDDGDRIYMIDAKSSKLFVYSFRQRQKIKELELGGACEDFIYPEQGSYYFASVLQHMAIYQISKDTDQIVAGYVFSDMDPAMVFRRPFLRHMALDPSGKYLYAVSAERWSFAVWHLNDPEYVIDPRRWNGDPNHEGFPRLAEFPHHLPMARYRIKGGYKPGDYLPKPDLIACDPLDEYVFVVDEDGALYIYNRADVLAKQPLSYAEPQQLEVPEPRKIVVELASSTTEIRDIAVTKPNVRYKAAGE